MHWIPATDSDVEKMLQVIGVNSIEDLFCDIPQDLRLKDWKLPPSLTEIEITKKFSDLSSRNSSKKICFVGGGYYDHYIPAVVDYLSQRGEFVTAYTPYQPECAQGTLQAIYEYQTAICRLTDMEVSNASLYDGGTALFEAVLMALRITGRRNITVLPGLNPLYLQMLKTHMANLDVDIVEGGDPAGCACVIAANPDFFGNVNDFTSLAEKAHQQGALFIIVVYPVSLGLLKTPGEMGADIVVAEGQSLGLPLACGGPYLGIMATKREYIRKMPGRISAMTVDNDGRRGFVLTLQAREQHIRREKAMSNICSNQALCALRALIYLSELGKSGIQQLAKYCYSKTEYMKKQLSKVKGANVVNKSYTFNEFVVRLDKPAEFVVKKMNEHDILAGIPIKSYLNALKVSSPRKDYMGVEFGEEGDLLIAVTEKRSKEEIDLFVDKLSESLKD
ncbi:MAG: aminomethyl-transferring glycine dehydrogenase subunit GcvPA [Candidatus Hydrogenedentes bacterium]|nr:aminomethyl-transferring glycine dehydrogenase subunit GcvPA [Candidatus Hydrogenedentota bacterium]